MRVALEPRDAGAEEIERVRALVDAEEVLPLKITREKARELAQLFSDPSWPELTPLLSEAIFLVGIRMGGRATLADVVREAQRLQVAWDPDRNLDLN